MLSRPTITSKESFIVIQHTGNFDDNLVLDQPSSQVFKGIIEYNKHITFIKCLNSDLFATYTQTEHCEIKHYGFVQFGPEILEYKNAPFDDIPDADYLFSDDSSAESSDSSSESE